MVSKPYLIVRMVLGGLGFYLRACAAVFLVAAAAAIAGPLLFSLAVVVYGAVRTRKRLLAAVAAESGAVVRTHEPDARSALLAVLADASEAKPDASASPQGVESLSPGLRTLILSPNHQRMLAHVRETFPLEEGTQ